MIKYLSFTAQFSHSHSHLLLFILFYMNCKSYSAQRKIHKPTSLSLNNCCVAKNNKYDVTIIKLTKLSNRNEFEIRKSSLFPN